MHTNSYVQNGFSLVHITNQIDHHGGVIPSHTPSIAILNRSDLVSLMQPNFEGILVWVVEGIIETEEMNRGPLKMTKGPLGSS